MHQYRKDQIVQAINENLEFSKTKFTIDDGFIYTQENNDIVNKNLKLAEKAGVFDNDDLFKFELNKIKKNGSFNYSADIRTENYFDVTKPDHAYYLDKPLEFKEPTYNNKDNITQRISQLNDKINNQSNEVSSKNKNKI